MSKKDLLVEIGTEELPPKALLSLSKHFQQAIASDLAKHNLFFEGSVSFASPRRLAVIVNNLQEKQGASEVEKFGPALKAAFDGDGNPTKAAEGFARSCGVSVKELQEKDDGKVIKLFYSEAKAGQNAAELLPDIINAALTSLPIPRRMRWGSSRHEFVRPVHWAVLLFGEEVVPATILGIETGNATRGHRFHHPQPIELDSPADYEATLEKTAYVIASFATRKDKIRDLIKAQAQAANASVIIDEDLLKEVTALVEWPVGLTGNFDKEFLSLPKEVLVSSLKKHQKCFTMEDTVGNIYPGFIAISNLESKDPAQVIAGNERVIRPRLADAAFFFEQDKKQSLDSRREQLKSIIFEQSLGTVFDKSTRVAGLCKAIAQALSIDAKYPVRAAGLAKADLLTGMVGEFTDLQGVMGYYYALHDGEHEDVAKAITEQYLPRFAGDSLPETEAGIVLAIAERIDTIVGLFGIGQPPTGSKDPFALRRAALGILRIIIEKQLPLDLAVCIQNAVAQYKDLAEEQGLEQKVLDFIFDRFRAWYTEEGIAANVFLAVDAVRSSSPLDFDLRIKAVQQFCELNEAAALSMANKRVSNILAKLDKQPCTKINTGLFIEDAEKALSKKLSELLKEVGPLLKEQKYNKALTAMASLQTEVDQFFNDVMVNTDDEKVRQNRQSLLQQLRQLFLQVADISLLQST